MPHEKLSVLVFAYWHDKGWKGFVGATVKIWDLANNMAQFGHRVELFLPKYDFSMGNPPFKLFLIPLLDFPFLRSLSFNCFLTFFLLRDHSKSKPDVVYIRRGISIVPAIFARLKKAVLIYEVNDDPYSVAGARPAGLANRFQRWLAVKTDEMALSWCNAAFVITKDIVEKVIRRLPDINPSKLHTLPSGANTDLYRPMDQRWCRLKLGLDISKRYIGFIGTLLYHQGIDVLIDAAPAVLHSIPEACFVIMGEGPLKDSWRQRADERSLQSHFLFTGQIDYGETPLWINAMDVCIAPFTSRAGLRSPVKIFDYMACGKPVVASRIPGTTDIFEGSGAVCLVEPENHAALAAAIVDILADVEKADEMGLRGRRLVETQYDRKVLAKAVEKTVYALRCDKKETSPNASI